MRCPKCHYLGFDSGDRCRNCGYEFSLAVEPAEPAELPIRASEPIGPLTDLSLGDAAGDPQALGGRRALEMDLEIGRTSSHESPELPLFSDAAPSRNTPLIPPRAARAPLSVRRGSPEIVRMRPKSTRRNTPADPSLDLKPGVAAEAESVASVPDPTPATPDPVVHSATAMDRVVAGLIDVSLLSIIDAAVLYFTLRLCGLTYLEIRLLPWAPLLGFFAVLNGGYFVTFTVASGQTIGKMARRIRVVAKDGDLHAGQAIVRTAAYVVSALPVGLGFAGALMGPERLALHDRLADTRVIKVVSP